ncbi:BMP/retinoic acid-inducible neural-specific protein 1 [Tachysurus ichikawai]
MSSFFGSVFPNDFNSPPPRRDGSVWTADGFARLQVTETRTGPLGCSTYDNLDSVSSVLLQSPESKLHLQGKD